MTEIMNEYSPNSVKVIIKNLLNNDPKIKIASIKELQKILNISVSHFLTIYNIAEHKFISEAFKSKSSEVLHELIFLSKLIFNKYNISNSQYFYGFIVNSIIETADDTEDEVIYNECISSLIVLKDCCEFKEVLISLLKNMFYIKKAKLFVILKDIYLDIAQLFVHNTWEADDFNSNICLLIQLYNYKREFLCDIREIIKNYISLLGGEWNYAVNTLEEEDKNKLLFIISEIKNT